MPSHGTNGPGERSWHPVALELRVRQLRIARGLRRLRAIALSQRIVRILELLVGQPRPDHQQGTGAITCPDGDVTRHRRAMEEVPLAHDPLLTLNDQAALTLEDHERLLIRLGVVHRVRLARPQDVDADSVVRKACALALEVDVLAGLRVLVRQRLGDVHDEPAGPLRLEPAPAVGQLRLRYRHHASLVGVSAANASAASRSNSPASLPGPCATSDAQALPSRAASAGVRPSDNARMKPAL